MAEIFAPAAEPLANYNYGELSSSIGWINLYLITNISKIITILIYHKYCKLNYNVNADRIHNNNNIIDNINNSSDNYGGFIKKCF